ncbi:hypothetical protein YC2023_071240 [Brassica napus]
MKRGVEENPQLASLPESKTDLTSTVLLLHRPRHSSRSRPQDEGEKREIVTSTNPQRTATSHLLSEPRRRSSTRESRNLHNSRLNKALPHG